MFTIDELLKATAGTLTRAGSGRAVSGISTDSRTINAGQAFIALKGKNFDGHVFVPDVARKGIGCVIVEREPARAMSPGCAVISVRDTTKALGDIARAYRRRLSMPVIGVTGSNGKTTTKEMIAAVLSAADNDVQKTRGTQNNHIGVPQTILSVSECHRAAVIELGTNHPGEIAYVAGICRPNIGIITSIGESHLEYLGSVKGVAREKMSLTRFLELPAILLLNADDPMLEPFLKKPPRGVVTIGYGLRRKTDFRATLVSQGKDGFVFTVNGRRKMRLRALGVHNVYNSCGAIACARLLGVGYHDICSRLGAFAQPAGRMRLIERGSVRFIDDTYNANPLSLREALLTLRGLKTSGRKIAVIGDMRELGRSQDSFHRRAGMDAARVCDALITVGEVSRHAAAGARQSGLGKSAVFVCASIDEARAALFGTLCPGSGDIVLIKGSRSVGMEKILENQAHAV